MVGRSRSSQEARGERVPASGDHKAWLGLPREELGGRTGTSPRHEVGEGTAVVPPQLEPRNNTREQEGTGVLNTKLSPGSWGSTTGS